MWKMMIIDDEYFVRMGIRETIDWAVHGVEIVGEADNGTQGLELACRLKPDIIITDIRMPGMNGLDFMRCCREKGLHSRIIVLSAHEEFNYAKTALQQGASDYLLKPVLNEQLIEAVLKAGRELSAEQAQATYVEKLSRGLSAVKEQALMEVLLDNQLTAADIQEKLELFDFPLLPENNYVVFVRIQEYHRALQKLTPGGLKEAKEKLLTFAHRYLDAHGEGNCCLLHKDDKDIVAIIHMEMEDEKAADMLKEDGRHLIRDMEERCPELLVAVGISLCCARLGGLPAAYKQAYMASYMELLPSHNSVAYYGDGGASGYRREITEALQYIRENYSQDITVESIAAALFISPSHLMHLFRDELHKTINECVTECRIQAAKTMLSNPRYKMVEISQKVGYKNEKYFTRVFKNATGMNPSEYARRSR